MNDLRAILVSVDYSDLLAISLEYNRAHFKEVMVVTSPADEPHVRPITDACNARLFVTDAFYDDGAVFNKFKALEQGLDAFGRHGLLCIMDADVLWPKRIPEFHVERGCLYGPLRRMMPVVQPFSVPPEAEWCRFPIHRNIGETAGFSQIFWAADPHLGSPPWHDVCFTHAGTADSLFQQRWERGRKVRCPFECLHIGDAGQNWCGRSTMFLDGSLPDGVEAKRAAMAAIWAGRRGKVGMDRFEHEKVKK